MAKPARGRGFMAKPDWIVFPPMDRERSRANIRAGMVAGSLALLVFALAFYVAILYLR